MGKEKMELDLGEGRNGETLDCTLDFGPSGTSNRPKEGTFDRSPEVVLAQFQR